MQLFLHLSILFWFYTVLQIRSSKSSNFLFFHTSVGISSRSAAFLFLIFVRTKLSSSWVNCPNLVSSWLLIIFMIVLSVIFGEVPSRLLKCSFHMCIRSSLLVAFILSLESLFLFTHFIYCLSRNSRLFIFYRRCLVLYIFFFSAIEKLCTGKEKVFCVLE